MEVYFVEKGDIVPNTDEKHITKRCTRCLRNLPVCEFHRRRSARDGLYPLCKECKNADSRRYNHENPEKNRERVRLWREENPGKNASMRREWKKKNPERSRRAIQKWEMENPEKYKKTQSEAQKKYRLKYPNKALAHSILNYAVVSGKIKRQPCRICGVTEKVHGHHPDYQNPLEVEWLCHFHHLVEHGKVMGNNKQQNGG